MPYNVIRVLKDKSEISFAANAADAWTAAHEPMAAGDVRVISVEGVEIPLERLEMIMRVEERGRWDNRVVQARL